MSDQQGQMPVELSPSSALDSSEENDWFADEWFANSNDWVANELVAGAWPPDTFPEWSPTVSEEAGGLPGDSIEPDLLEATSIFSSQAEDWWFDGDGFAGDAALPEDAWTSEIGDGMFDWGVMLPADDGELRPVTVAAGWPAEPVTGWPGVPSADWPGEPVSGWPVEPGADEWPGEPVAADDVIAGDVTAPPGSDGELPAVPHPVSYGPVLPVDDRDAGGIDPPPPWEPDDRIQVLPVLPGAGSDPGDPYPGDLVDAGGDTGGDTGGDSTAKPRVSITAIDSEAWEGPYTKARLTVATFQLVRTEREAIDVKLTLAGDAQYGSDYVVELNQGRPLTPQEDGSFVIPFEYNEKVSHITIYTLPDHDFEWVEKVLAKLQPATEYQLAEAHQALVLIHDRTVDLDIATSIGRRPMLHEEAEDEMGAILRVNDDYDSQYAKPDYLAYYDGMPQTFVRAENDTVRLKLESQLVYPNDIPSTDRQWFSLRYDASVLRVWYLASSLHAEPQWKVVQSGSMLPWGQTEFAVEGIGAGQGIIELVWSARGQHHFDWVTDQVSFSVWHADLDIDSDNSNGLETPDRTDWEEELENHPYALGKLVFPAPFTSLRPLRQKFTPLVRDIHPLEATFPYSVIQLDYALAGKSGGMQVWTVPSEYPGELIPLPIEKGGHLITPGRVYRTADLYASGRFQGLWINAEYAQSAYDKKRGVDVYGKAMDRITLRTGFLVGEQLSLLDQDTVRYMVVNPDSFYANLQWPRHEATGSTLRDAIAALAVYSNDDLPQFALKRLDTIEMQKLGISQELIQRIRAPEISGFNVELYRDYVNGEYILVFAGTDDLNDVIEDIWQGAGRESDQYVEAMELAVELNKWRAQPEQGWGLRITGHSLGGGLASAASVASGLHANTFNAAGLHFNTLFQRNSLGNVSSVPRFEGIVNRFQHAETLVDAWYVEYDLLSFLQDNLPPLPGVGSIPRAVGRRRLLIGPYDAELAQNAWRLASAWKDIKQSAATAGSWKAWRSSLVNGQLGSSGQLFSDVISPMASQHKCDYVHYGIMTKRDPVSHKPLWDIFGDWIIR